jgi:hypothetical protein
VTVVYVKVARGRLSEALAVAIEANSCVVLRGGLEGQGGKRSKWRSLGPIGNLITETGVFFFSDITING